MVNVENYLVSSCLQYLLVHQAVMLFLPCVSSAHLLGARLAPCKRRGGAVFVELSEKGQQAELSLGAGPERYPCGSSSISAPGIQHSVFLHVRY